MSSSVKVFIDLLDVNDNKPTFVSTPYVANPSEEKGAGLFVIKVNIAFLDYSQGIVTFYFTKFNHGSKVVLREERDGDLICKLAGMSLLKV